MGIGKTLGTFVARLLGRSAYQSLPSGDQLTLDSPEIQRQRETLGGQLQQQSLSQTRWYLSDLESAELTADGGDMAQPARLMRSARKDGILAGVLSTCTDGLVRLPKKFIGDAEIVRDLEAGHGSVRSIFDEMVPATELALMAADGRLIGISVGELVPVAGRDYPVLVRLDPEFLMYRWNENRWYFRSVLGLIPITPGDGRWVLHSPGGRMSPWQHGIWRALGRAFIRKEHASLHKDNWEGKLANPARVATMPSGAGEEQAQSWFQSVMAWGINTVFGLRPGYDVKLLESNGRGWESFNKTIEEQNNEIIITIAGQTVTTEGGKGFQNSDLYKTIRTDIIKSIADGIAYTCNTQILPPYIASRFGIDAIEKRAVIVEWDVTPPKDRNAEALSMVTLAQGITGMNQALYSSGQQLDVAQLCTRFGIPVLGDVNGDGAADGAKPTLTLVPPMTDSAPLPSSGAVGVI